MCTRFVYRGDDMITGFNFDIDLTVWNHKIEKERRTASISASCGLTGYVIPIMV